MGGRQLIRRDDPLVVHPQLSCQTFGWHPYLKGLKKANPRENEELL